MIPAPQRHFRWRLGALAGLAVVVVSFIPELTFWAQRGSEWNGSYACVDPDEMAYSAYLAGIMAGRPRRNNPYVDVGANEPADAKESLFSIQFFPPYAVGLMAQALGVSASTSFILLLPIFAFASSMAVFWLLSDLTSNDKLSALGVLVILLCAVLVSEYLFAAEKPYYTFAFLRRYIPAVPFPLFFLFCLFVWRALTNNTRISLVWSALAGLSFCLLVFSYFYLWTSAAAWFASVTLIWILIRPSEWRRLTRAIVVIGVFAISALLPYFYLLVRRAETTDTTQGLIITHAPDLYRSTEIFSLVILILLGFYSRRMRFDWKSPLFIFAVAFTLTPFVVFNQQVITGRSLQPFHYEQFIVNYLVLVGAVLSYYLIRGSEPKRPLIFVAVSLGVGLATALASSALSAPMNQRRDEAVSIYTMITDRSGTGGTTLFDEPLLSAAAPTSYHIPMLWSPYMYTYGTTSADEERERFFQYLYYLGVAESQLEYELKTKRLYRATLFGLTRVNRKLSDYAKPITEEEIRVQTRAYSVYTRGFSREHANRWPLSFVILEDARPHDLSNLDRWYARDGGQRTARAIIYRVHLRPEH